jgi:hypothetical protein
MIVLLSQAPQLHACNIACFEEVMQKSGVVAQHGSMIWSPDYDRYLPLPLIHTANINHRHLQHQS